METDNSNAVLELAVYRALDRVNELLVESQRLVKSRTTALMAGETTLDSLSLINLLLFIEDEIREQFACDIMIAGEEESGQLPAEALNTVGSLIDALEPIVRDGH